MSRIVTYKEVKEFVESLGYELIDKNYISYETKLTLKDSNNYYYFISYGHLRIVKMPERFAKSNPYTIQNIKLWCNLNNKPFELLSDIYEGNNKKLQWRCFKEECGEIFNIKWNDINSGHGCGYCTGRKVGLSNCLATKNPELAKEWHPTKNGNLTPYDVTCGSHNEVWWQCNNDITHIWKNKILYRNNGDGYPQCNESKGEKIISEILKINNIYYIPQKTFENLFGVGNGNLSYDFYLPDYNLLIEYQGEQHKKMNNFFHRSKKDFERQIEHDRRKREYALKNNIKLLEIWYWDFDNIESIISDFLFGKEMKIYG